jgi:hypothetical protein
LGPVYGFFPPAEEIQIRAVNDQHLL